MMRRTLNYFHNAAGERDVPKDVVAGKKNKQIAVSADFPVVLS